jgi:nucleoside-diphosphate-sugar epimerase
MLRVIITGADGYIGKNFIKRYKKKIFFIIYKGDINKKKKISEFIQKKKFDIFIHLAALLKSSKKNKKDIYKTNSNSLNHISSIVGKKKKKLIFISSSHVYKRKNKKIKEIDELKPCNLYGKSKLKAEKYILKNCKNFCILRVFNIFGHDQPLGSFYSDMVNKIKNKENISIDNSYRDFVHVNDLCKILFFIIKKNASGIYNVSSGKKIRLRDIIDRIEKKLKKKTKIKFINKCSSIVGDNSKITKLGLRINYKNILKFK